MPAAPLTGLAALALLLTSCSHSSPTAGGGRPGAGVPVPVLTAQAEARDVPVAIHTIGNVQAYSMVAIRSQITGAMIAVPFQEGQEVKTGDLLFSIDPRPWQAALNQAEANLQRDQAQLIATRLTFERTSNLFVSKIASREDYDTAEANDHALESTLLADRAAISSAQASMDYTAIRSPIDGRTGNLTVKAGNVVKAPDDVLLTITQVRPIYVAFSVPEQNLPTIRRQSSKATLAVEAVVPSETNRPAYGELTFINNSVDTNTGTIFLKGTFANTNEALWPGQFVQVSLTLSNLARATVVPSQAVQTGQNGEFVFVVLPDRTVTNKAVTTRVPIDGSTVIAAGVNPGDTVVTDGQLRLVPGARVSFKPASPPDVSTNALATSEQK